MSDSHVISIHITLKALNDSIYEPPTPSDPELDLVFCEQWESCANPHCYEHGCQNALRKLGKEARS